MSAQWYIQLTLADANSLARLRLTRGIEVAEKEPFVWVRGNSNDEKLEPILRSLPAVARYVLSSGNRLRNLESRIPSETLPALNWQPVNAWLRVSPPLAMEQSPDEGERVVPQPNVAEASAPVSVRIVRSAKECRIDLLITSLAEWHEFVLRAPEVRLRQLRFAADENGSVVVRGRPLPPLPGRQFVLHANIAVRAGFTWEPAVSADVIARRLGLASDALGLFHEDGTFSRIESEQFVPATRSAVRETVVGFGRR